MAKQTQDREDLLGEGSAMPIRGKFFINSIEIVIGFRRRGQLSLYWDQDPVFQFDADSRLRRVFMDSHRFRAAEGRLVRLEKINDPNNLSAGRLRLVAQPVTAAVESAILQVLPVCLQQIDMEIQKAGHPGDPIKLQTIGISKMEFASKVRDWISQVDQPIKLSDGPSAS